MTEDETTRMPHFYDLEGKKVNVCGTVQNAGSVLEECYSNYSPNNQYDQNRYAKA